MSLIENRTFDEIRIGDAASLSRTLTRQDIELFAVLSGDVNPLNVDEEFARSESFHKIVVHGMWGAVLISTLLGTELPGAGTLYREQRLRFLAPLSPGDAVVASVRVSDKFAEGHRVRLEALVVKADEERVIEGTIEVEAPTEKISQARVVLPEVRIEHRGARHLQLIARARAYPRVRMAVVDPVDAISLSGAFEAAQAGLIEPILVGPPVAIREAASAAGIDIAGYELLAAEAGTAAARAVALVATGGAQALMKGALHTDTLMHAVLTGEHHLRGPGRVSHVFVMDVPSYPRLLLISDAAINVEPDLVAKRDIVQNAINLAHALGVAVPRVAILSAVETVTPKIKSTLDAAELCRMARSGEISGGVVDGPLAFDNAVSAEAARIKGIVSQVAGAADILVMPNIEAGNMLAKQLEYLADADGAGIVLGAKVPIVLTSRADKTLNRIASCATAALLAHREESRS